MKAFLIAMAALMIVGCSSTTSRQAITPLNIYPDHHFITAQTIELESEQQIFAVSPQMRRYVQTRLANLDDAGDKAKRLINDLFSESELNIHYLHNANFTASETFDNGSANCLSLTLLSYVLIEEAGLDAQFIDVRLQENWTVMENVALINGHVNLRVTESRRTDVIHFIGKTYTIDFLPMSDMPVLETHILSKAEIIALFYNNKGAEALTDGNMPLAYQYFKAASKLGPTIPGVWGNLASLYRRQGLYSEAEQVYLHALKIEPDNLNLQENLARLYSQTGNQELASEMLNNIDSKRQQNPFYHAMLAQQAYFRGEFNDSIVQFKKAIKLNDQDHTFYFGLAKSYAALGDAYNTKRYLSHATKIAKDSEEKAKYQSKLSAVAQLSAKR